MVSDLITIKKVLWRNNEKGRVQAHFFKKWHKVFPLACNGEIPGFHLVDLSPFTQSMY